MDGNGGGMALGGVAISAGLCGSSAPGGATGAAACEGGITYSHFGHFTARPACSSRMFNCVAHDGQTTRTGMVISRWAKSRA
jgi:hypothetical protein